MGVEKGNSGPWFSRSEARRERAQRRPSHGRVCGDAQTPGPSGTRREQWAGPPGAPGAEFDLCKGRAHIHHHPGPSGATRHRSSHPCHVEFSPETSLAGPIIAPCPSPAPPGGGGGGRCELEPGRPPEPWPSHAPEPLTKHLRMTPGRPSGLHVPIRRNLVWRASGC